MSADDRVIDGWAEFGAYVEATYQQAAVHAGTQRARFALPHLGRDELVFAWAHDSPTGAPWLGLAVWMGHHTLFRKRSALVANQRLPMGALALLRDAMLLSQTLPLTRLRIAHIEETLAALCDTVANLNESAKQDAPEDAPFAYLFTMRMRTLTR